MERLIQRIKVIMARLAAFCVFVGVIGLGGLIFADIWGAVTHKQWEHTVGTVIENNGHVYRTRNRTYWARFTYEYKVNGRIYQSEQVWFFEKFASYTEERWQAFLDAHPQDSQIVVFYNPLSPRQAIIEPVVSPRTWVSITVASCAIIPGFLILYALSTMLWTYGRQEKS